MVLAAVLAMKGGSGKTTTSMHVGHGLAAHGSTCVYDTSPQQSAWKWAQAAGTDLSFTVEAPRRNTSIATLAQRYDHVIVDTPPEILPTITETIRSVEIVIGCVRPTWLDLEQSPELAQLVDTHRDQDGLPVMRWLLVQASADTENLATATEIFTAAEQPMFDTIIPSWQRYQKAAGRPLRNLYAYAQLVEELLALDATLDDD